MGKLVFDKKDAKLHYDESPEWLKAKMVKVFGKECFEKKNFQDIRTFNDACKACGTSESVFNKRFKSLNLDPDTITYEKVKIITKAINQEWVPDWNNTNQKKWWAWFNVSSSGFGFSYSGYDFGNTATYVGSRLCFESKEKSDYAGKQFSDIYKEFLL